MVAIGLPSTENGVLEKYFFENVKHSGGSLSAEAKCNLSGGEFSLSYRALGFPLFYMGIELPEKFLEKCSAYARKNSVDHFKTMGGLFEFPRTILVMSRRLETIPDIDSSFDNYLVHSRLFSPDALFSVSQDSLNSYVVQEANTFLISSQTISDNIDVPKLLVSRTSHEDIWSIGLPV